MVEFSCDIVADGSTDSRSLEMVKRLLSMVNEDGDEEGEEEVEEGKEEYWSGEGQVRLGFSLSYNITRFMDFFAGVRRHYASPSLALSPATLLGSCLLVL